MAVIHFENYAGTDLYSDGEIENIIAGLVKERCPLQRIYERNMGYPVLYHLSHIRENILNWYPFTKADRVLEVGAGCGAITGALCKKAGWVSSVELSKRRARINYERHRENENLEIIVGNINDIILEEKYDFVVLNGVLEYAAGFTEEAAPYRSFLNRLKTFLKPEGRILIAIENRLGLKYFSGAAEDHTAKYFLGLNGYRDHDKVRTFSRAELKELLEAAGFSYQKFYYPYPDYKFPSEIFTERTLLKYGYGKEKENLDDNRFSLFRENTVWEGLRKEEVIAEFANSFLVDAGLKRWRERKSIEYVKLSNDREETYQIATVICRTCGKREVAKLPLQEKAAQHIAQIHKNEEITAGENKIQLLKGKYTNGVLQYPFIRAETLAERIGDYIGEGKEQEILQEIKKFFAAAFSCAGYSQAADRDRAFAAVFGPAEWKKGIRCIRPANIDLICDNIFLTRNGYTVIDGEWVFDFPIPCAFIQWRCVNELYARYGSRLQQLIPREKFLGSMEISEADEEIFRIWADHFTENYLRCHQLKEYYKPLRQFSLNDVLESERSRRFLCSSLYYDSGDGFCEENKLYSEVPIENGRFTVEYDLCCLEGVRRLRWDPVERDYCECTVQTCKGFDGITALNADMTEGDKAVFLTEDPMYELHMPAEGTSTIVISGVIRFLTRKEIIQRCKGKAFL